MLLESPGSASAPFAQPLAVNQISQPILITSLRTLPRAAEFQSRSYHCAPFSLHFSAVPSTNNPSFRLRFVRSWNQKHRRNLQLCKSASRHPDIQTDDTYYTQDEDARKLCKISKTPCPWCVLCREASSKQPAGSLGFKKQSTMSEIFQGLESRLKLSWITLDRDGYEDDRTKRSMKKKAREVCGNSSLKITFNVANLKSV